MSREKDLEKKYGKILFEDAIVELLKTNGADATKIDGAAAELADMFEYYGVKRLSEGFAKLVMPSQMYIVGGIIHRFTAGMPDGAGFAEVKMENSEWQCLLVRKDAGYENEVNALIAASEE